MPKGDLASMEVGVCNKCGEPIHAGGLLSSLRPGQIRICLDCLAQKTNEEGVTNERERPRKAPDIQGD